MTELPVFDRTTRKNILWATDNYISLGVGFEVFSEITPNLITGPYAALIQPRIAKPKDAQAGRTRDKAEVFTPSWICNKQNNLIDAQWFGRTSVFNVENKTSWTASSGTISFQGTKKDWKKYVDAQRLEVSCGEAPYLVSRYDTVTGERIPLYQRIGLLDRKMRVVQENAETPEDWLAWAQRAFESVYGFEYQGDNLLLARENRQRCGYIHSICQRRCQQRIAMRQRIWRSISASSSAHGQAIRNRIFVPFPQGRTREILCMRLMCGVSWI